MHDKNIDKFYLDVLLDTLKRVQPDVIVLAGDIFDCPEFGKYNVDPRDWDVVGRIKFAHENILAPMREICPTAQIDFIEGNHECVHHDTEILTESGWVLASNVNDETKIASYAMDGQSVSYDTPISIKYIKDSNLVSVTGNMSDELVSDTHRADVDGKLTPIKEFIDKKINQTRFRYAVNANNTGVDLSDDEIRLLTWIVCDGTIVNRTENNKRIQFKLSKERKITRLESLLERLNFNFTKREANKSELNKLQPYYICLYSDEARWAFDALNGVKEFPQYFKNMNKSQAKLFMEELSHTDGSKTFNHIKLTTTSKTDAELVQLVGIMNDIPTKIKIAYNSSGFENGKPQYYVNIYNNGVFNRNYNKIEKSGVGDVIAIQSANGTLITRRNGKVGFTGNCRILKHLADATPALRAVLSDLHGMTVAGLLGLDKFKINYIAKGNLATYSLAEQHKEATKNYKIYFDSFIVGHEPYFSTLAFPGISGHHHKTEISSHYNAHFGNYQWIQIGGGHKLDSEYSMSKWNHGFCIAVCDTQTKETIFEPVTFTQNMAVVGGKIYQRQ
jgi:hypothetical protein